MDFLEIAKKRYSVRKFKDDKIHDNDIRMILEAGRVSPTAKNFQPVEVIVIRSEEGLKKINGVCECIYGAPLVFAVVCDTEKAWKCPFDERTSIDVDSAIVCTQMMNEAADLGYGTCMVGWFNVDEVNKALGLPEGKSVRLLLPTGVPADDAKPAARHFERKPMSDFAIEM